jgi:ATP-dependent DNA helicase RecQ
VADPRLSKRHLAAAVIAGRRVERRRWDRLAAIDAYASGTGCRRSALLRYFSGEMSSVPADQCCDVCGAAIVRLPDAEAPAPSPIAGIDPTTAVLHAVDETGGRVGRTRIVQILRGSRGRALVAAGHDRLGSYAVLPAHSAEQVLATVDSLIDSGALELTGGPYPLVRRAAGSRAATARDAELREQVRALGTPGAEDGVAFLARVLSAADDPELRALAAESLERIGGERAAAALAGT